MSGMKMSCFSLIGLNKVLVGFVISVVFFIVDMYKQNKKPDFPYFSIISDTLATEKNQWKK